MIKWEYQTDAIYANLDPQGILNAYGIEGWELVNVMSYNMPDGLPDIQRIYMKRVRQEEEPETYASMINESEDKPTEGASNEKGNN